MNYFDKKPKANYGFVYKYTSPSGKSYIGQTCRSLKERAGGRGLGYTNCSIFFSAIQKYGFENFNVEILEEVLLDDIDNREKYYIELYHTIQPNGYNVLNGGKHEYRNRKRKTTQVIKYDLEGNFIKKYESVKEAANEAGCIYQTIECILNGQNRHYRGFIYRRIDDPKPEPVEQIKTHGRITAQYDLTGKYLNKYPSANAAARAIGKKSNAGRNIRLACEGKRKSAYGFKWKFLD